MARLCFVIILSFFVFLSPVSFASEEQHEDDVSNSFYTLPNELLVNVFKRLDIESLIEASQTNRLFDRISHDYQVVGTVFQIPYVLSTSSEIISFEDAFGYSMLNCLSGLPRGLDLRMLNLIRSAPIKQQMRYLLHAFSPQNMDILGQSSLEFLCHHFKEIDAERKLILMAHAHQLLQNNSDPHDILGNICAILHLKSGNMTTLARNTSEFLDDLNSVEYQKMVSSFNGLAPKKMEQVVSKALSNFTRDMNGLDKIETLRHTIELMDAKEKPITRKSKRCEFRLLAYLFP